MFRRDLTAHLQIALRVRELRTLLPHWEYCLSSLDRSLFRVVVAFRILISQLLSRQHQYFLLLLSPLEYTKYMVKVANERYSLLQAVALRVTQFQSHH